MSIISQTSRDMKKQLKEEYLSGITVAELAKRYNFKYIRTVYYHLNPLTIDDKQKHVLNRTISLQKEVTPTEVTNG